MNQEEFSELVAADVRDTANSKDAQWLRQLDNIDRWKGELTSIMRKIDSQITLHKAENFKVQLDCLEMDDEEAGKKRWLEHQAEEKAWHAASLRFKRAVGDRLQEAKNIQRELAPRLPKSQEQITIVKLRSAVQKHKKELTEDEEDVIGDADLDLWKVLESGN